MPPLKRAKESPFAREITDFFKKNTPNWQKVSAKFSPKYSGLLVVKTFKKREGRGGLPSRPSLAFEEVF